MTRQLVALTLTVLMHIVCFAIMTERKYSVKKTVSIYFAFLTVFVCFAMLASRVLFDIHSFYATSLTFLGTMLVSFIIFMVTSADPACKKVFLFLSYSSMFCIFRYRCRICENNHKNPAVSAGNMVIYRLFASGDT